MSAATLTPVAAGPADAAAAAQRVAQLQALVAQAGQGGSPASFAAALQAASGEAGPEGQATAAPNGASGAAALTASGVPMSPTTVSAAALAPGAGQSAAAGAGGSQSPLGGSSATPYDATIAQAATRNNIDPAVLHGLIQQESGFDPNSRSSAGALGLTQLMPGTASSLGVTNPLDPTQSIEGGARYLSEMMSKFGGNVEDALAAYNAGPGAVSQYGGVPPYAETQQYVSKVLGYANAYRQSQTAAAPTGSIA